MAGISRFNDELICLIWTNDFLSRGNKDASYLTKIIFSLFPLSLRPFIRKRSRCFASYRPPTTLLRIIVVKKRRTTA